MAIKVYKGGSWVNTTGISAIGNADKLAIGQTNTSLATSDKAYYLSFVDANHGHTSRQYEDFYTGIGITFSPITNHLTIGGSFWLKGSDAPDGDIISEGGNDGKFGIYNRGSRHLVLSVLDSAGADVGIVTFSSETGNTDAAKQSIFDSNIYPKVTDTYNLGKSATELRWNNVYANCFHGDGTGLTGTGFWEPDNKENLKAGTDAGSSINNHTCYNIFIGYEAGKNTASAYGGDVGQEGIADENIFIGKCSGHSNTTGGYNIFGGSNSGFCNLSGGCNVAFGKESGYCVTGSCNIFLGLCAGRCSTTGSDNIFMGYKAGFNNAACNDNIFLGFYSGTRTTGTDNIALGYSSLLGGPTGGGESPLSGQGNVAIGKDTGKLLGGGAHSYNVFLGYQAGQSQTAGSCNVVIGYNASTYCSAGGCQLSIGINADKWITGDSNFNIRPGKGIIDCSGSCGTEGQVLTSHKVAGTPDDYYVKWNTNVSTATNADRVGIGTTTNVGGDDVQEYYVPFVTDNNAHNNRQYEQLYSDSKLVYSYKASNDTGQVRIGDGAANDYSVNNDPGSVLQLTSATSPKLVLIRNDISIVAGDYLGMIDFNSRDGGPVRAARIGAIASGVHGTGYNPADLVFRNCPSLSASDVETLRITSEGHVGIGTTNPIADNITTALDDNDKVLAVGIVTAKEYYGLFKGTIDPDASITLDKIEEGNTSAEVVDTGTDGHFKVLTEGSERFRIASGGMLIKGNTESVGQIETQLNQQNQFHGNDRKGGIRITDFSDSPFSASLEFVKSRNATIGQNTILQDGDRMGSIYWGGANGTNFQPGAFLTVRTDGTVSSTSMPTVISFGTNEGNNILERLRIGSSGQIGLSKDVDGTWTNDFGTNNQVLTSKGPNSAAVWQTVSGIPASTSNQLKITKTSNRGVLYLLGVQNGGGEDTAEGNITTKTVYQKTQNTLFFDTITDTLRVPTIRGELVAGGSWPAIQGNLTIETNHLIPSSNVTINSQGIPIDPLQITNGGSNYSNGTSSTSSSGSGTNLTVDITTSGGVITNVTINTAGTGYAVNDTITVSGGDGNATLKILYLNTTITGGQNLGSATKKWAEVYAQKFVGHLGGTADSTEQIKVQKNEDAGNTHYFGMIMGAGEKDSPTNQTVYTDTALSYLPSNDTLISPNIDVSTKLHVKGNTELGDQLSDEVTWTGRSGTIQPSGTPDSENYTDKDLGSTSYKWNNVYARTFNGAFQGTAQKAGLVEVSGSNQNKDLSLTFIEWESGDDDPSYEGLKFDADRNLTYNAHSNVLTVPNLAISGITTLGDALNTDKTIFKSKVDSNIIPLAPASGLVADRHDIGSPNDKWGIVYATEFSGTMTGSVAQVNTEKADDIDGYVTFVENNHNSATQSTVYTNGLLTYNSNASSEKLTVGGQLKVNKDAEFDEDVTLGSAADDKVTFNSKIAAPLTLGIGQILPYSPANEAKTAGIDLGSTGAYWKTIYAREFKGAITGNADSASKLDPGATINLTTGAYTTTVDFSSNTTAAFTGDSAYTISAQLNATGVTLGTYGSTTSIPQITVDAKGRITSASNKTIDLTGATADKAKQLEVTERDNYGTDYIPFVIGAPTATATAKTFYADGNLRYRSASDMLITSKISPDGSFPSAAGKIATTKQVGANITWEWGEGTASGIGRNYTLPLTAVTTGNSTSATWTLTDNVTPTPNTNAIQLNAGTGLKISSASPGTTGGSFTISMDTSSNTAFKYKNTYASNAETTNKADAVLQIYPENGSAGTDQKITIKPGTGIKFSGYGAQTLTIESDADVGASTVDIGKCSDINHSNPWHFVFVDSRDGGSETLYVDDESPVPIKYNNDTDQLQTTNLYVTGNTILGDALADADTVTWNAKSTTILPTNSSQNLGSQNDPWGTVYANNITGTLTVNTTDNQVLYTDTSSGSAVVAGSDLFTYDGITLEVADAATAANFCQLTRDGGIEICRTNPNTGGSGGAFVDFKDNTADDYTARIQLATHMANGGWNSTNDRGGLLFETGGTAHRHMLLTKDGVLGITRGTTASAILSNNGSNHTIGFVPGMSRDASVAAGHNIANKVALDVNGTLMLRANTLNNLEGGQITINNCEDTIGYSIDVYGSSAGNSLLRIIDEKTITGGRGTQRFAISRTGAFGIGDVGNESWGNAGDHVLISGGSGGQPYWGTPPSSGGTSGMRLWKFTSTQNNWTPPTGYTTFVFMVVGGGGGSGSADGQDDDGCDGSSSGGGGGGGCSIWRYQYSNMGGTYTLTVGAGGAGGPKYSYQGNNGHGYAGGQSKVSGTGINLIANGGGGSNRSGHGSSPGNTGGGTGGGDTSGSKINFTGETGFKAGGPGGSAGLNNYYGRGGHGQTVCDSPAAGNAGNGGIIIVAAFP